MFLFVEKNKYSIILCSARTIERKRVDWAAVGCPRGKRKSSEWKGTKQIALFPPPHFFPRPKAGVGLLFTVQCDNLIVL